MDYKDLEVWFITGAQLLYGGDDGKKWSSDIIKIYLPKKWKAN